MPEAKAKNKSLFNPDAFIAIGRCDEIDDEIVVLRLPVSKSEKDYPDSFFVGKNYELRDGRIEKLPYNRAGWFNATSYGVGSIDDVHEVAERSRLGQDGGFGCMVMGAVAPGADPRSLPRSKTAKKAERSPEGKIIRRGRSVGLVDAKRRVLIMDCDGIPSFGMDPRINPIECLEKIKEDILPPVLASARTSAQFSGSCCLKTKDGDPLGDGVPATIGVHFRFWLDEALNELERKALLLRLRAYALARCGSPVVDSAVAIFNQAIFTAVRLQNGLIDPFPGDKRSCLLDGNPTVCVSTLLSQLPEAAPKVSKELTPEQAAARKATKKAASARKSHDALLRAAARIRAKEMQKPEPVPAPSFSGRDPLVGSYGRGKLASIHRRQQTFRQRALTDIGLLVAGRKQNLPGWENGVPDGYRLNTIKAIGALLSFCVPADRLACEIERAAVSLVSREWYDNSWLPKEAGKHTINSAFMAETMLREGGDPDGVRTDRCKTALMNHFRPTDEEQLAYGLKALRTEAIRSDSRRRAAFVPTRDEYLSDVSENSVEKSKPWVAEGISRGTWYNRRRAAIVAATPEQAPESDISPESDTLTIGGLDLVISAATFASNDDHAPAAVILAAGTGIGDVSNPRLDFEEVFLRRANELVRAGNTKGADAMKLARGVAELHEAWRQCVPAETVIEGIVLHGLTGIMKRAHALRGERLVPVMAIMEAARGSRDMRPVLAALMSLRASLVPPVAMAA